MRLFFAVDIPGSDIFHGLFDDLKSASRAIRPVHPENHHISLKFIGDTKVEVERIIESIRGTVEDRRSSELYLDMTGAFPSWKRPSVLWFGSSNPGQLKEITREIDGCLHRSFDMPPEARDFKCHLTVARIKDPISFPLAPVRAMMEKALHDLNARGYLVPVNGFHLYNSTLTPGGPVYTKLASFPFAGGE